MRPLRHAPLLALLACNETSVDQSFARLTAEPEAVQVLDAVVGEEVQATVLLHAGLGSVFINHVEAFGVGLVVESAPRDERVLEGDFAVVELSYLPESAGVFEGWITVDSDAADGAHLVVNITVMAEQPATPEDTAAR